MVKISIIVPTLPDNENILNLQRCLTSLLKFKNVSHEYELVIVSNNWDGFSKPVNKGIRQSTGDYVLLLNDDTEILAAGIEDIMLTPLFQDPTVMIVGHDRTIQHGKFSALWCTMIRKELFNKIGLLDEDMNIFSQDIDLGYKCLKAGYKTVFVNAPIQHFGSVTTNKLKNAEDEKKKCKKVFYQKHGVFHDEV